MSSDPLSLCRRTQAVSLWLLRLAEGDIKPKTTEAADFYLFLRGFDENLAVLEGKLDRCVAVTAVGAALKHDAQDASRPQSGINPDLHHRDSESTEKEADRLCDLGASVVKEKEKPNA